MRRISWLVKALPASHVVSYVTFPRFPVISLSVCPSALFSSLTSLDMTDNFQSHVKQQAKRLTLFITLSTLSFCFHSWRFLNYNVSSRAPLRLDSSQDDSIFFLSLQTPSDMARRPSLGLVATITHSPLIGTVPTDWDREGQKTNGSRKRRYHVAPY